MKLVAAPDDDEERCAAVDAMRGVATHHTENSCLAADTGVIAAIAPFVQDTGCPLKLRTSAWNLLNILATNVVAAHPSIVDAGLLPLLIREITGKLMDEPEAALDTGLSALTAQADTEASCKSADFAAPEYDELRGRLRSLAGKKTVVVMRGLPGSGKTYVTEMIQKDVGAVCSADVYFQQESGGEYSFDVAKIRDAHRYCR
eukprot:SAG31_NODE_1317_length_8836_cov_3.151311_3_plen_202_part_00